MAKTSTNSSGSKKKIDLDMLSSSKNGADSHTAATSSHSNIQINFGENGSNTTNTKNQNIILQAAKTLLVSHQNKPQTEQALEILNKIGVILATFPPLNLPEIRASLAEDGSIGLSWNFADASLGITIDLETTKSNWFLLVGQQNKGMTAYGTLGKMDIDLLLSSIVNILNKLN